MSLSEIGQGIYSAATQTSIYEYAAFVTAILYVVLAARENILCWLFGIISSLIYVYICLTSKLYLETGLQAFYVAMGFYGWWQWTRNKGQSGHAPIVQWKIVRHLPLVVAGALIGMIFGYLFSKYTQAAQPYLDAMITSYSLIATWMVSKKIIENWIYWIVIDAASIILYGSRQLYLSSLLFLIYTILAAYGFIQWRKELKASRA